MKQYDFSDKKLYNDMPPRKGMKIAPIVIQNRDIFINMGYSTKNMETFHSKVHGGKEYLVSFIEVPEEQFDILISSINYTQNLLGGPQGCFFSVSAIYWASISMLPLFMLKALRIFF